MLIVGADVVGPVVVEVADNAQRLEVAALAIARVAVEVGDGAGTPPVFDVARGVFPVRAGVRVQAYWA